MPADYCFGERKFGGNAQAITRGRWLHHTTFLWDFDDCNMGLLKHPERAPAYREVVFFPLFKFLTHAISCPYTPTVLSSDTVSHCACRYGNPFSTAMQLQKATP